MQERTLSATIDKFLISMRKMIFISGPRQCGKTTLVEKYQKSKGGGIYFNWDVITDQRKLAVNPYFFEDENRTENNIIVFDEIHKYAHWKNYLKGAYDKYKNDFLFIVTGSGRLDLFKKGGDSLLGRYVSLPLFPFTLGELSKKFPSFSDFELSLKNGVDVPSEKNTYENLFELSGFPEPLLRGEKSYHNIWNQERRTLLIRTDIRDATNIREISLLEMLSHMIAERVGNPLSINSLREDLGVAFETVRDWIKILAQFYYLFQINPFSSSLKRTLKKETKTYLFDWAEIDDIGSRFENLVALHLLKSVKTWSSLGEGELKLRYIRDKEKREVDFVITKKNKPVCLIEAKSSDDNLTNNILYYQEKLNIPVAVQIVHKSGIEKKIQRNNKIQWVVSADKWLLCLP